MSNKLKKIVAQAPTVCGVYKMYNINKEIIYIGKANNLRKRLCSYTNKNKLSDRMKQMVKQIHDIEFVITQTQTSALLLEAELIKAYKAIFNIQLKDDKSFPYIVIDHRHQFPSIYKYRGKKFKNCIYYGPFASASLVNNTIDELRKIFNLRSCSDSYFKSRTRPCLDYQIGKCSAPCVNKITKQEYDNLVYKNHMLLLGKDLSLQMQLKQEMLTASKELQYEKAGRIRNKIQMLIQIQVNNIFAYDIEEADIFTIYEDHNHCKAISIFFIRYNKSYGQEFFFPAETYELNQQEILQQFILQFYSSYPNAKKIIANLCNLSEDFKAAIKTVTNSKVSISKIDKQTIGLNQMMLSSLKQALEKHHNKSDKINSIYYNMKQMFHLHKIPQMIEVLDNSHIQGKYNISAIIVANSEGFIKKMYKKYSINFDTNDDYKLLQEGLIKRFINNKSDIPDLLIIDGGIAHLNIAIKLIKKLEIAIDVIAISKGKERILGKEKIHTEYKQNIELAIDDTVLHYLQKLRDEAHRFAINSYRKKHLKNFKNSLLDSIPRIGNNRKLILLSYFGSIKNILNSSIDDIAKTPKIGKKTAEIIYNYLHNVTNS